MVETDTKSDVLRCLLKNGGMNKSGVMYLLKISDSTFQRAIRDIRNGGIPVNWDRSTQLYTAGVMKEASPLETELLKTVKKLGLEEEELRIVLENLANQQPRRFRPVKIEWKGKKIVFGAFTDAHMGHNCYRPDVFAHMVQNFVRHNVDFVVNCGDTLEGMSNRDGHVFELSHLGMAAQKEYFKEQFEQFVEAGLTVYSIEAGGSHTGWSRVKANQGHEVPEEMAGLSEAYKFIGWDEQDLILSNGLRIRLRHPGGGSAYALSYKMQKYVNGLGGGDKPHIILQGHFHKAMYMFYRNIHCIDAGCLQNQSPFMKKIGTPAHVGYWIVEVCFCDEPTGSTQIKIKDGVFIESFKTEFIPFYD